MAKRKKTKIIQFNSEISAFGDFLVSTCLQYLLCCRIEIIQWNICEKYNLWSRLIYTIYAMTARNTRVVQKLDSEFVVEYLTEATTDVLKEAPGWQQPVAHVTSSIAFLFNSMVASNRHVYHSPGIILHHLAKPQELDAVDRQAWRLHPEICIDLQVLKRIN